MYPYHLVGAPDGARTLTVFVPGAPVIVADDHPHFAAILDAAMNDTDGAPFGDEIRDLADLSGAVAARFDRLSDRVTVAHGRVYFDGDQVDNALTRHLVRVLDAGTGDWYPLVRFLENVAANPQTHSREQLWDWLRAHDFTITQDGCIVGYKGVARGAITGALTSVNHGDAIVDGEAHSGAIPNHVGAVVEMPRSQVAHDPGESCSRGLHVGTYDYAQSWARGAMLRVVVNPRDVVSVPTDASGGKVRVCRYTVAAVIDAPDTAPIAFGDDDPYPDDACECDNPYCAECADDGEATATAFPYERPQDGRTF